MMLADLRALLLAIAVVSEKVGTRIYPAFAPKDAVMPRIVLHRIFGTPIGAHDGQSLAGKHRVQLDIFAELYSDVEAIAAAIGSSVNDDPPGIAGFAGVQGDTNFGSILIADSGKDYPGPPKQGQQAATFRREMELDVWVNG